VENIQLGKSREKAESTYINLSVGPVSCFKHPQSAAAASKKIKT